MELALYLGLPPSPVAGARLHGSHQMRLGWGEMRATGGIVVRLTLCPKEDIWTHVLQGKEASCFLRCPGLHTWGQQGGEGAPGLPDHLCTIPQPSPDVFGLISTMCYPQSPRVGTWLMLRSPYTCLPPCVAQETTALAMGDVPLHMLTTVRGSGDRSPGHG